jgi:hypothetical protein
MAFGAEVWQLSQMPPSQDAGSILTKAIRDIVVSGTSGSIVLLSTLLLSSSSSAHPLQLT